MEGYVEYQAARAAIRDGALAPLAERIEMLQSVPMHPRTREYYEWNLVVEHLCSERGYSLEQVMDERVTLETARQQMLSRPDDRPRSP